MVITDRALAKAVSAAILEGPVPVWSDFPIAGDLPAGLEPGESGPLGICISWRRKFPFDRTLLLVPPVALALERARLSVHPALVAKA